MKITRYFVVAVISIASLSLSSHAQRQTKLYIDDGTGLFMILKAGLGGGTLTLPTGTGMIVTEPIGSPAGTGLILQPNPAPGTAQTGNFNITGSGTIGTTLFATDIEDLVSLTINTVAGKNTTIGNSSGTTSISGSGWGITTAGAATLTSISGLTTPLSIGQGGTGQSSFATGVLTSNGSAISSGPIMLSNSNFISVPSEGLIQSSGSAISSGPIMLSNSNFISVPSEGLIQSSGSAISSGPIMLSNSNFISVPSEGLIQSSGSAISSGPIMLSNSNFISVPSEGLIQSSGSAISSGPIMLSNSNFISVPSEGLIQSSGSAISSGPIMLSNSNFISVPSEGLIQSSGSAISSGPIMLSNSNFISVPSEGLIQSSGSAISSGPIMLSNTNFISAPGAGVIQSSGTAISSGAINLTSATYVSGTLPLGNGGTNNTSYTSGKFIAYDGSALTSTTYDNTSFAPASSSSNYIQNNATITPQTSASFNIDGSGSVGTTYNIANAYTVGPYTNAQQTVLASPTNAGFNLYNIFVGFGAGAINTNSGGTVGHDNAFVGTSAGNFNTTGSDNTYVGSGSGSNMGTGSYNTYVGAGAGTGTGATGYSNTYIGVSAGNTNSTGFENAFFGRAAGESNHAGTGNDNTLLGFNADITADGLSDATAIGSNATVSASNTIQLGDGGVTLVNTSGSITSAGLTDDGTTDIEGTTTINTTVGSGTTSIGNTTSALTLTGLTIDMEDPATDYIDINSSSAGTTNIGNITGGVNIAGTNWSVDDAGGGNASFNGTLSSEGNSTIGTNSGTANSFGSGEGDLNNIGVGDGVTNNIGNDVTSAGGTTNDIGIEAFGGAITNNIGITEGTGSIVTNNIGLNSEEGAATVTNNFGGDVYGTATVVNNYGAANTTNNFAGTTSFTGSVNLALSTDPLKINGSAGTSGYVLTSGGPSAAPTWTMIPTGNFIMNQTTQQSTADFNITDAQANTSVATITNTGDVASETATELALYDAPSGTNGEHIGLSINVAGGATPSYDVYGTSGNWKVDNAGNLLTNGAITSTSIAGITTGSTGTAGALIIGDGVGSFATINVADATNNPTFNLPAEAAGTYTLATTADVPPSGNYIQNTTGTAFLQNDADFFIWDIKNDNPIGQIVNSGDHAGQTATELSLRDSTYGPGPFVPAGDHVGLSFRVTTGLTNTDIVGTANSWNVTSAGAGTFVSISGDGSALTGITTSQLSDFSSAVGGVSVGGDLSGSVSNAEVNTYDGGTSFGDLAGQDASSVSVDAANLTGGPYAALDGSSITNLTAGNIASGTASISITGNAESINGSITASQVSDFSSAVAGDLPADVTTQGNIFNGISELVETDASGDLPGLDGSELTNVNAATLEGSETWESPGAIGSGSPNTGAFTNLSATATSGDAITIVTTAGGASDINGDDWGVSTAGAGHFNGGLSLSASTIPAANTLQFFNGTTGSLTTGTLATSPVWTLPDATGVIMLQSGPFTQGSAIFAGVGGVLSEDNSNYFWDATHHRLGIGTATPSALLSVGASNAFRVDASGNLTTNGSISTASHVIATSSNTAAETGSGIHVTDNPVFIITGSFGGTETSTLPLGVSLGDIIIVINESSTLEQFSLAQTAGIAPGGSRTFYYDGTSWQ